MSVQNFEQTKLLENTEDFRGLSDRPRDNTMKINSNGMKFINESGLYTLIMSSKKPLKILKIFGATLITPLKIQ